MSWFFHAVFKFQVGLRLKVLILLVLLPLVGSNSLHVGTLRLKPKPFAAPAVAEEC